MIIVTCEIIDFISVAEILTLTAVIGPHSNIFFDIII